MSCEDIPSLLDLQKVKKHAEDFGRLMGTGTGTSTNGVTGQVRPTYNKVIGGMNDEFDTMIVGMKSEFDTNILNMGFARIGTFSSGATITNPRQTILWDVADGGDGQEYGWSGSFLPSGKVVPPGSTPLTTGGIAVGAWMSRFDPEMRGQVREALRRSYAEAGYNLVDGSFEVGGTLVNANDALLQERTGKGFTGPAGTVAAGTVPSGPNYINRGDETLRSDLANPDKGAALVARGVVAVDSIADLLALPSEQRKEGLRYLVKGYHAGSDVGGGEFYYDPARRQENDSGSVLNGFVRIIEGHVTPSMFGARGDGVTDDTDSINSAIALAGQYGTVVFPGGQKSFLISSELVMLQGQQWVFEGGQRASKLLKAYNGNVIKMGTLCRLISPFVDGNGATYAGTNIVIPSGTFSQYLENVRTVASQGPGVLFEKNAGGGNRINGIEGDTTSPETVGVISLTEDTTAVPRFWNDVYLSGGVLDLTGGGNGLSVSNFYIRDILTGYTGLTRSGLFKMSNGRLADLGGTSTLTAADSVFTNTSFATNLTLVDCQGVKFSPTCHFTSITENNDNSRFNVWYKAAQIHNSIWTASDGSLGDIGNGTLNMRYSREGESCKIQLELTFGTTTTPPSGSGQWLFTLPFRGYRSINQRGLFVNIYDSSSNSDTFALGTIAADTDKVGFGINGQGVRNGYPIVWAAGDKIIANFEYLVR